MKIREVSEHFQISSDTLRYYEKLGLIGPIEKKQNIRHFSAENLEQIEFVLCMKRSGMELNLILHFITLYQQGATTLPERIQLLEQQKQATLAQISQLQATVDYLDYKLDLYTLKT
ncbi:MAG: MerR family transcriptional regulator [Culicoidibacterales bacterium]